MRRTIWIPSLALAAGAALAVTGASASPEPAAPPAPSAPRADTFEIDPVHSGMIFRIGHLGVSNFYGRFNQVRGTFVLDQEHPGRSTVTVEIDAASVDSNSESRDRHIKSPDFLNVKEYPTITFDSKKVVAKDGDVFTVTGDLTFHGETRELTVDMTFTGESDTRMGYRAGFEGQFEIDRGDFGVKALSGAVGDEVRLILFVEGMRQ